jgi:predicted metal-dependent hydrolase
MHRHHAGASDDGAHFCTTLRQRVDPHTGEVLFTMDQVKDIVRRAVDEKERALREQYDRILAQKLQEQYQAFAKFNEDYISRTLKNSDLAYVS